MERKDFIKNSLGLLGASLIVPKVLMSCKDSNVVNDCEVWASETQGPFPTKKPEDFLSKNIKNNTSKVDFEVLLL